MDYFHKQHIRKNNYYLIQYIEKTVMELHNTLQ